MPPTDAARLAVELLIMPARARHLRLADLPDGIETLLRIAAGDPTTLSETAARLERPENQIVDAAAFFIEQILLSSEADSYRVFGLRPDATPQELRHNMALLLRWLHPDLSRAEQRSTYIARVTKAWEDIKTPERRTAYDRQLALLDNASAASPLQNLKETASSRHARLARQLPRSDRNRPLFQRGLSWLVRALGR